MNTQEKLAEASRLEEEAKILRKEAQEEIANETRKKPLLERLIFAAFSRCDCGAGLAYDPVGASGDIFKGYWECSKILLGTASTEVKHSPQLPFMFYEIKSENQPSAGGYTTRPSSMVI